MPRRVDHRPLKRRKVGIAIAPDGRWIYVANAKDTTVSVVDTKAKTRVADIEVGGAPVQVAFAPDGRHVYASHDSRRRPEGRRAAGPE